MYAVSIECKINRENALATHGKGARQRWSSKRGRQRGRVQGPRPIDNSRPQALSLRSLAASAAFHGGLGAEGGISAPTE